MIYMFLSNYPSSGDINSSNLPYSVLFLLCFRAILFIDALWSSAGKGLTSRLSFVMSNCEVVTFQLVSWVRCGA